MPFLFMLAAIVVITVVALVAVGRLDATLPDVAADLPPLALPEARPLAQADVDGVRFGVGMRGKQQRCDKRNMTKSVHRHTLTLEKTL